MSFAATRGDRRGGDDNLGGDDGALTTAAAAAPEAAPTDRCGDQASTSGTFIIHKVEKKGAIMPS